MPALSYGAPIGDEGPLPERFRELDGFDLEAFLVRRQELRSGIVRPEIQTVRDESVEHIFRLCGWRGGPVNPNDYPCITNLHGYTPWSFAAGLPVQFIRTQFLNNIESVSDIRRLYGKGWLTNRDAIDAFMLLWHREHGAVQEINQHDGVMFGITDPRVDVKKAVSKGLVSTVFDLGGAVSRSLESLTGTPFTEIELSADATEEMRYSIQGREVRLKSNGKEVFPPSNTGMFIAENIRVKPGEQCFDVGVGSGIQAIVMAQQGGIAKGSDTNAKAVEYAQENACRSGVGEAVSVAHGAYFAGADEGEQFDVVVANLPQTPAGAAPGHAWAHAIEAGSDGISIMERFLDTVIREKRLKPGGRIYICAASIANSARLKSLLQSRFTCRKVAEQYLPVPPYVERDSIQYLAELNRQGINDIVRLGDQQRWYSKDTLLELKLAA